MAGKHRKNYSSRFTGRRRFIPGLTAAAVSATGLSTALVAGTTTAAAPAVKLAALITPANSTAQIFASSSYYGRDWSGYGQPQVVPFLLGPQGIVNAIDQNNGDPKGVVVLSSGWGAGQTSTALATMQANHDPAINNLKLVVLDNNTNRAGGGFWTTYWMFAPLLLTSAAPTPSDTTAPVVDTAYEYNINSDAPTYPIDLLADLNSLVAYVSDYGGQATAPMPAEALSPVAPGGQHYHYIVASDGTVVEKVPVAGNITYVTFASDGLPLVQPLRALPGGNVLADAMQPVLTDLVNWGYQDNSPIPQDPGVTRPVGLLPPTSQDINTAQQLPGGVTEGVQAVQKDLSPSTSSVTKPLRATLTPLTVPSASVTTSTQEGGGTSDSPGSDKARGLPGSAGTTPGGLVGNLTGETQKTTAKAAGSLGSAKGPSH